jgi:hypothetical protein
MTSPLPTPQTKSGSLEARNLDGSGLLQLATVPNGSQLPSFESFIPKNDQNEQQEKELEEIEAAKKRKRTADAALVAAPSQPDQPELAAPSLDGSPTKPNPSDTPNSPDAPTQSLKQKEAQNKEVEEIDSEIEQEKSEADSTYSSILDKNKKNSDGIENAKHEDEMISLTTFDEMQGSSTPNMSQESAITSVSRLASVASFERSTATSISVSNAESESNFSQLMSGNPSAMIPTDARSNSASPSAKASALFKALPPELEKFKQSGQSQIQLDLPVGDGESVRIRLNIRAGEIRSTFITESPELREALQKAWPEFTATHRTPNLQFGESNFQDGLTRQNNTPFDQGNRRQYQPDSDIAALAIKSTSTSIKQPAPIHQNPAATIRQGKVNLWA